ncbi:MAG: hypothetical protein CMH30_02800 [Micavibrio sp.]|nr:hypothetical protein [Micavibrio sp.]|tara:strand:+ start:4383 stop:4919 length:537 start_codon:yes stop_codon:yes gene_type:complete
MAEEQTKSDEDLSIEEILSSIRDIISEDDDAPEEVAAAPEPEVVEEEPEEIEPLTEEESDAVVVEAVEDDDEILELSDPIDEPETEPVDFEAALDAVEDDENLLSENTASASLAALDKLSRSSAIDNRRNINDAVTIEDITREMLRPMLKAWLDKNLPDIIERTVQKEIRRLSSKSDD